jgi:hypothetical protein
MSCIKQLLTQNANTAPAKPLSLEKPDVRSTNVGPFSLESFATQDGAYMKINYTAPGGTLPFFQSYQWIQTVSTSGEFEKFYHLKMSMPHIDGMGIEKGTTDNYPFYYTTFALQTLAMPFLSTSNYATSFHDWPRGETWFDGEVTLVEIDLTGRLTPLGTFLWGYFVNQNGVQLVSPMYSPTPSPYQQTIIQNYNNKIP